MKSYLVLVIALSLATPAAISQQIPKEMPEGFDSLSNGNAKSKLETITAHPQPLAPSTGFTTKKKYPVLYLLHGIAIACNPAGRIIQTSLAYEHKKDTSRHLHCFDGIVVAPYLYKLQHRLFFL